MKPRPRSGLRHGSELRNAAVNPQTFQASTNARLRVPANPDAPAPRYVRAAPVPHIVLPDFFLRQVPISLLQIPSEVHRSVPVNLRVRQLDLVQYFAHLRRSKRGMAQKLAEIVERALKIDVVFPQSVVRIDQ